MKIDLHLYSKLSKRPSIWLLKKIGCAESYAEPAELYRIARSRGMDGVTITDHNAIEGALEIAHLPGAFVSCEVTTYFPDDNCKLHVLVYGISEEQFREIDKLRANVFELVSYLREEGIFHALAHPFYAVNDRLTVERVEQCVLLFKYFELNGDQAAEVNEAIRRLFSRIPISEIERMSNVHGLEPGFDEPWRKVFIGGSDDHSSLNVANTFSQVENASSVSEFFRGIERGEVSVEYYKPPDPLLMAHNIYGVAYQFYGRKFSPGRMREYSLILRFLDGMLRAEPLKETSFLKRVYFKFKRQVNPPPEPPGKATLSELIQYEAQKKISSDPELSRLLDEGESSSSETHKEWFGFVSQVSDRISGRLARDFRDRLSGANPLEMFGALGGAGALYATLAPYFISYSLYSRGIRFAETVEKRFHGDATKRVEPKVVVFTDTFDEINGVARTWNKNVRLAARSGKKLTVVTCSSAGGREEAGPGVKYFKPVEVFETPEYPEQKLFIPPFLEMLRYCYENNFTHVHGATPGPLGLAALAAARLLKLPFYTTYHTSVPEYALYLTGDRSVEDLLWRFIVWFYDQSDLIFSPSLATSRGLVSHGVPEYKLRLMPRGVDAEAFTPARRREYPGLPAGKRLLYVGRVSREKNLELLGKAFKMLSAAEKEARLVVVGDGPYLKEMKREMEGYPCFFTGYKEGEELASIYASCDLFVFPSATDTFGNVVLEAQASGLPVIVTDKGGPKENLLPERTGLVVEANDAGALFQASRRLLASPERAEEMGRNARLYAETRSFDKAFNRYWDLYKTSPPNAFPKKDSQSGDENGSESLIKTA